MLNQLWLCICTCFYTSFITEWSSHSQTWHHDILHPNSLRPKLFPCLISLSKHPPSKLQNSLLLIRSFRFLIDRKRNNFPFILFFRFCTTKLWQFRRIIIIFLTNIGFILLNQNSPRIPNIKNKQFLLIDKYCNKSWSS